MSDAFPFLIAVVGDESVMTPDELARLLDVLVNRHRGTRRIVLVTGGGQDAAGGWAVRHGYSIQLVPTAGNRVKRDCELVSLADAVVILGDPGPWRRLESLCREAGVPVRVYRSRPKLPAPTPPAWDVG